MCQFHLQALPQLSLHHPSARVAARQLLGGASRVMAAAQPDDELIARDLRLIRSTNARHFSARSQLATPADSWPLLILTILTTLDPDED